MDELIKGYAQILRDAKIGDYTYEGVLADFAREVRTLVIRELQELDKSFNEM